METREYYKYIGRYRYFDRKWIDRSDGLIIRCLSDRELKDRQDAGEIYEKIKVNNG
jgi:hypothetical protein